MDTITGFLIEFVNRLTSATPRFFRILQRLAAVTAAVSAYAMRRGQGLPPWLDWLDSAVTLAVALTGIVMSALVVDDPDRAGHLPITNSEQAHEQP